MRGFIDALGLLWQDGKLADTTVQATSASNAFNGAQEASWLSLYLTATHWWSVIVAPGNSERVKIEICRIPHGFSMVASDLDETHGKHVALMARCLVGMHIELVA